MPFVEGLTISGFPEKDDLTLRFQTGLNILDSRHPERNAVVESLSWFFNSPEPLDVPPETTFTAQSYLEIRIRSDQPEHSFWELRGRKKSSIENVIQLRRVLVKPGTVLVDDKSSRVPFDEFRFEMAQLGFCFGTSDFPTLNVVRRPHLDQLIKPAGMLWKIVHAGLRVEAFRRLQDEEQDKKDFYRKQLNSALAFDYQSKIDEFKERIDLSRMFCKLEKTLNFYAASVAQREVNTYARVAKFYESKLERSIAEMEALEAKREELDERLDEYESAVPEMRELVLEDLKGDHSDEGCRLAKLESEEQLLDLIKNVQDRILNKAGVLKSTLKNMLGSGGGEWIQKYEAFVKLEVEIEIDEICMHASFMPTEARGEFLEETRNSLTKLFATSKTCQESIQNTIGKITLAIEERGKLLVYAERNVEHDVDENTDCVNELAEISRNLTQTKLASVTLQNDIRQKSYTLLQHLTVINHISSEIVMGVASIEHFLQTTEDSDFKQNFAGFVWQHLAINVSTIANLALPHLTDILTLAIFHKQEIMSEMLTLLPPQTSYNVLALDKFAGDAESFSEVPSNVSPLSDLLVESPLKPILTHLLRTFYYTKVPYEKISKSIDPDIVLICVSDKLVIGGGFLAGGWPLNAQNTLEKLSEAVSLAVEILKLKLELTIHTKAISNLESLKNDAWNKLELLREDTFHRFNRLLQAFPTLSDIPFWLEHLVRQQTFLTRQQVRIDLLGKFLKHLKVDRFQDQSFYVQRIHDGRNALEQGKREWYSYRKTLDKSLVQLKDDLRSLGELLVNSEALRTFSLPLKLHRLLVARLTECKEELEGTFQQLSQEHAGQQSAFDALDQLDLIQRETIEAERQMMRDNFLLREVSAFHQELRRQHPVSKLHKKTKADLQYVYEARLKLKCTQPAYKLAQIERFKFKLEMCRNNLQMLTAHRKPHVCNMTLPCINKLAAIKLRLITQMMANIPSYLNRSGSLRLNFQYDQTKCSDDDSNSSVFNIENIIGLTVEFVDEEQHLIRNLNDDSATLIHLIFFACFLSVEGCKLLLLQDCFTGLSQEEQQDAYTLLLAISQNMQIFLTAELDE